MSISSILTATWPSTLDPETVPFKGRTVTVLRRAGLYDDWSRFNGLSESDVMAWWNTGPITVEDLRITGDDAIRRHHDEVGLRRALNADLDAIASQSWAPHVWFHDPRFTEFVPKGNETAYDIATWGTALDRRYLRDRRDALRASTDAQGALSLVEAVAQYVEAISGQHGDRLDALLARTGLGGEDPILGIEAGRRLGVSQQRIHQIVQ